MSLQILKKISVATLSGFSPKQLAEMVPDTNSAPAFVGRILGKARSYEVGQSTYGDFLKFKGDFRAFDVAGKMSASAVAFLPAPVDELLRSQIEAAREAAPEGTKAGDVEFAFDIMVVHDPKEGSKGYQYRVQTLTETQVADPVAALLGTMPALPSPAKKEEPEPTAEAPADDKKGSKK